MPFVLGFKANVSCVMELLHEDQRNIHTRKKNLNVRLNQVLPLDRKELFHESEHS